MLRSSKVFVEDLPVDLFPLLKDYSAPQDYTSLMNSNKATFQTIKYETVQHCLLNPHRWLKKDQNNEAFYYNLTNHSIKDKSKQIILNINKISESDFLRYVPSFQGIYKLSLSLFRLKVPNVDFNAFNNIHHVSLSCFDDIVSISSGFENVTSLEISDFMNLKSITGINITRTLQSVSFSSCSNFEQLIFPTDRITIVKLEELDYFDVIPVLHQLQAEKVTDLTIKSIDVLSRLLLPVLTVFTALKMLNIDCAFIQSEDLSNFHDIPDLHVMCIEPFFGMIQFQQFFGKHLHLEKFNVYNMMQAMLRDREAFQNIHTLRLELCHGLLHLPALPELRNLNLSCCDTLISIPTFRKLRSLSIEYCKALVFISPDQPALRECDISQCPFLENLSFAARDIDSVTLHCCDSMSDISLLCRVKSLSVSCCPGVTSLAGLSGDTLRPDQRKIELRNLENVTDFSPLHHIGTLHLVNLAWLHCCHGIHDIECLQVESCDNLVTTAGLRNITKFLAVLNCKQLKSFADAENIPMILVQRYKNGEEYLNLKNRLNVICKDIRKLSLPESMLKDETTRLKYMDAIKHFSEVARRRLSTEYEISLSMQAEL